MKYSVIIEQKPEKSEIAVQNLRAVLGIKVKTAASIVNSIPLRIYSELSANEARIIVETLNSTTCLQWKIVGVETNLPTVSWNKIPKINGLSVEQIIEKNDPEKTGVKAIFPEIINYYQGSPQQPENILEDSFSRETKENFNKAMDLLERKKNPPKRLSLEEQLQKDASLSTESSILPAADSYVAQISEEIDSNLNSEDSTPAFYVQDSQNLPGVMEENILSPGIYNLYLPAIKTKEARSEAKALCIDILDWTEAECKDSFSKPIICVAKDIDDIDGSSLISQFQSHGIQLNSKRKSKL